MIWARMLAYITGTVDQELLLRNEYWAAENRILRAQIKGRLLLSDPEKATLGEIAQRLGRQALEEVAAAPILRKRRRPITASAGLCRPPRFIWPRIEVPRTVRNYQLPFAPPSE